MDQTSTSIPQRKLQHLEFLLGESIGMQTLYLPGGSTLHFPSCVSGTREHCDRFLQIKFFAKIPAIGDESFNAMITFSSKRDCYEMWLFSSSNEEPLHMTGNFSGPDLVFVSDPWPMAWGLQRLRATFTHEADEEVSYLCELWEPDGYVKFSSITFGQQVAAL